MIRTVFWAINAGLMLMVILDLFPAGAIQFRAVVDKGLWYGRSAEFIHGGTFETLTWLRGIGATIFFFGGVIPLAWFMVTRLRSLKKARSGQSADELDGEDVLPVPDASVKGEPAEKIEVAG